MTAPACILNQMKSVMALSHDNLARISDFLSSQLLDDELEEKKGEAEPLLS